jgi:hypothetical protein
MIVAKSPYRKLRGAGANRGRKLTIRAVHARYPAVSTKVCLAAVCPASSQIDLDNPDQGTSI